MDHCDQGKLNIPRIDIEEFGKNIRAAFAALQSLNRGAMDSKAVEAILLASEKAVNAVVEKHPKRGDAWAESFSISSCMNLAGAKLDRVELIMQNIYEGKDSVFDCGDEMDEEATDAVAYIAFGMWMLGKL